jgi:hypothetical protein
MKKTLIPAALTILCLACLPGVEALAQEAGPVG